jgi:long-chain acyl-CoA synthetase
MHEVLKAFTARAVAEPDRIALIDGTGTMRYGELYDAVRRTAAWAVDLPERVGVAAPKTQAGAVLQLALAWAGRTVVPLPEFFSPGQLGHLAKDAALGAIVAVPPFADPLRVLGLPVMMPQEASAPLPEPTGGARWIIYTSGTTGAPKGVVHGERQMDASVHALADATAARADDRMLSVLPYALLLELVAGLALPLSVGASIALCPDLKSFPMIAEQWAATATILVPELLAAWVAGLEQTGRRGPRSLRFVAVGGAPVPPALAERAWALGLPVHEGYGLSECCSVVAVNRPGERAAGSVGRPIPGVEVDIDDGEIVVSAPTVMEGYLGGTPAGGRYRTGDAGHFDEAGRLIVEGRIDDVIVTTAGRNIHPGWIESMILADPRIARCAVIDGGSHPRAVLVPADPILADAHPLVIEALVEYLTAEAPAYARPRTAHVMSDTTLARHGLITANGRLRRRAIASFLESHS